MIKTTIQTMNVNVELEVKTCPVCFVVYAVSKDLLKRKSEENGDWYCPNGHNLIFTKSDLQKLKEDLEMARENEKWWKRRKTEADERSAGLERRLSAQKGQNTRLRNRIANGVCPCCRRTFQNLHKHMKNQHPDFRDERNQ